jgi:hypothetical protein
MVEAERRGHDVLKLCKFLLIKVPYMKNETVVYAKIERDSKGDTCCKIISKAGWTNITSLNLRKT